MLVCVRARVCACVRECMRACVRVCICLREGKARIRAARSEKKKRKRLLR